MANHGAQCHRLVRACWVGFGLVVGPAGCDTGAESEGVGVKCALAPLVAAAAGTGAKDCGDVAAGGNPAAAYACARDAAVAGKAFRATFSEWGTDSLIAVGLAGSSSGVVSWFTYDGCPKGCGDEHPSIYRVRCWKPAIAANFAVPALACGATGAWNKVCSDTTGAAVPAAGDAATGPATVIRVYHTPPGGAFATQYPAELTPTSP